MPKVIDIHYSEYLDYSAMQENVTGTPAWIEREDFLQSLDMLPAVPIIENARSPARKNYNLAIQPLNVLISQYNAEANEGKKIELLYTIYQEQRKIDHQFNDAFKEGNRASFQILYSELIPRIHKHFLNFGFKSLEENYLQSKVEHGVEDTSNLKELFEVIGSMSANKVDKMIEVLSQENTNPKELQKALQTIYPLKYDQDSNCVIAEPGAREFYKLLETHSVEFLGGNNSRNYKITNMDSGAAFILKVENRLGMNKTREDHLRQNALQDVLSAVYVERNGFFTDGKNKIRQRSLLVTEYSHGGDLQNHANKMPTDGKKIADSLHIYTQMATIVENIRNNGSAFPDMKNSNWLIEPDGTLRIADTKSFLIAENNVLSMANNGIAQTPYYSPPETRQGFLQENTSVDKMHAYILGVNIYDYLSKKHRSSPPSDSDFDSNIFKSEEGLILKGLIENLMKPEPADRISVAEALSVLTNLQSKYSLNKGDDVESSRHTQKAFKSKISELRDTEMNDDNPNEEKTGPNYNG